MLSQLSVKNLAVVEYLDLEFAPGMSSVTGETGAGKSILIQALGFALGSRGDSSVVRHGKNRAEVSVVFDVYGTQKVQSYLQEQGLDDGGECVLRRVIGRDGRSKAYVNGSSVSLSTIRGLGDLLIDMHGQNEHQLLLRSVQQLDLLDSYAKLENLTDELNFIVSQHKALVEKIEYLTANNNVVMQQQELLIHQLEELSNADIKQEELDTIESDYKVNANAKSLIEKVANILNQLESDTGANSQLIAMSTEISHAMDIDPKLSEAMELLSGAQLQSQECVYTLTSYLNSLSVDEQATTELEERLSELYELARKHGCRIVELLETKKSINTKLAVINKADGSLKELLDQQTKYESEYHLLAAKITNSRTSSAIKFSDLVTKAMQTLGMPGSEFKVSLVNKAPGVHLNGLESIEFLVKTNTGQELNSLSKVASGGELSRVSLAISVVTANSEYAPTLVFDEVDVGISGATAEVVGRKLKELSEHYQVICITHLAQVASFGHQHLRVTKVQKDKGAITTVEQLSNDDRVLEVARIIGGVKITKKARKAAEEMIKESA